MRQVGKQTPKLVTAMVSQATSSVTPVATATTKPTYGATSGATSTAAYAASSATAVSYQTVAAITSPTVSRYNRLKVPVRGVKQTSTINQEKPISLNGGDVAVSQMQQSLGNFWQTSYHQWTPQSNQVLDEQSMLSLIYQNSLKSNTAKKDSAIGAAEATAKISVQKDKVTFGLKVQSLSVEKFEEKNNKQNSDIEQYLLDSAEQFSYGNYTDKQTVLGSLGSIGLAFIGLDLPGDLRDISADLVNWQWTWGNAGQLALDTVSIVPVFGIMKYADEGTCILKAAENSADDMVSSIKSFFKTTDKVDEAVDVINKGGSKADFYVTPSGDAVPSTGYRYFARNPETLQSAKKGILPAKADGMYFSFDKMDDAIIAQGKLQIPYRPEYRASFDTLQIMDDIKVPNGNWGRASYLEPIAKDFMKYGPGKATQAITKSAVRVSKIFKLR